MIFVVGGLAGLVSVRWPYLLLDAGSGMVIVGAICLVGGTAIFQARSAPVGLRHIVATAVPWLAAAFLWGNGSLDPSEEVIHQTSVINTYYARSWDKVTVRSWRAGQSSESLYLQSTLISPGAFHSPGDSVTVGVKPGAFGLPWVSRITF